MRNAIAAAAALFVVFSAAPAGAIEYPWCAEYGYRGGATNCGFTTYRQCLETVFGIGGYCRENPFYYAAPSGKRVAPRVKKKRRPVAR